MYMIYTRCSQSWCLYKAGALAHFPLNGAGRPQSVPRRRCVDFFKNKWFPAQHMHDLIQLYASGWSNAASSTYCVFLRKIIDPEQQVPSEVYKSFLFFLLRSIDEMIVAPMRCHSARLNLQGIYPANWGTYQAASRYIVRSFWESLPLSWAEDQTAHHLIIFRMHVMETTPSPASPAGFITSDWSCCTAAFLLFTKASAQRVQHTFRPWDTVVGVALLRQEVDQFLKDIAPPWQWF